MTAARGTVRRFVDAARLPALGAALALVALTSASADISAATPLAGVDLSTYVRVGRFDLPEPTRTQAPPNNLLAQEASGVAYDWDTDTLFVVGDGGTSVTQVTKTGQLVDTMTLAPGSSPQGTDFYDTEGIAYVGGGKFVVTEERDRQANLITYAAGTTITHANAQTVKLGTTIGNVGIEGLTYDPLTSGATRGFIFAKETDPIGIFQSNIDFTAGTATNGSPTTVNSINLFDPALAGLGDFSDVFALANLSTLTGPQTNDLLIISQESGRVVHVNRSGTVLSSLTIVADPGDTHTVPDMTQEGVTMDNDGRLYIVNEEGGGDINHPQLWVYAPSSTPNQAPGGLALTNQVTSVLENTSTATRLRVAGVSVTDDGLGTNNLTVTGPDASAFEVDSTGLYVKAGTVLDFETKSSYSVTVNVDDPGVGSSPDASASYTLAVTDVANEQPPLPSVYVSEVSPWSSGSSPYMADWFELTNTGTAPLDITGWKIDDDSNAAGNAVALNGVTTIGPGRSAVFVEGTAATADALKAAWFGTSVPVGFTIGSYSGGGVGLGTGGDAVNVFDASNNRVAGVRFGTSTTGRTFDNAAGVNGTTLPLPLIDTLSTTGTNGAFLAADGVETGSPGTTRQVPVVTEVSPWSSGNAPYAADWWELTNTGTRAIDITGWKMDDDSNAAGNAVALNGVSSIAPGQSGVFIEGGANDAANFRNAWFAANVPFGFAIGFYSGGGVGLGAGGDAVNIFDALGNRVTGVRFGTSTTGRTFDNTAGLGSATLPLPLVSMLSAVGVNGAFVASDGIETGSPGRLANTAPAIALSNQRTSIAENTATTPRIKVADVTLSDDTNGTNLVSLGGADSGFFELDGGALYLRAGTSLNFEAKTSYAVTVAVDDPTVGGSPDSSDSLTLGVTDVNEAPTPTKDAFTANQSVAKLIPVAALLANDTDPDANTALTLVPGGFGSVIGGTVALQGGNVVFTPAAGFSGTAGFSYTVTDGSLTGQAVATIEVGRTDPGANGNGSFPGTPGDDDAHGGNGDDVLFGLGGVDRLTGDNGDDTIRGGDGNDDLDGGNGDDLLFGEGGNDTLHGANGADLLSGGAGDDVLSGANGGDTFVIGGGGTDVIEDFGSGGDVIGLTGGLTFGSLSFVNVPGGVEIRAGGITLAVLNGVAAAKLTPAVFVTVA